MKPWHLHRGFDQLKLASHAIGRSSGNSEHPQPARGPQRRIAFFPVAAANWINDEFNAAVVSKLHQDRQPVLIAIVDRMIEAALSQEFMLAGTRRSISCRSDIPCNIQRSQSHPAAGVMNQYRLATSQTSYDHQQSVSRQVVNRNRRCLFETQSFGLFKYLVCPDRNFFCLPSESGHRHDWFTQETAIDTFANLPNRARNFIAHYARLLWSIRIQTLARQDVREIQTGRADINYHFSQARLWVRRRLNFQNFYAAVSGCHDLSH